MRPRWTRSGRFQGLPRAAAAAADAGRDGYNCTASAVAQTPAVAAARFASADGDSPAGGCRAGSRDPLRSCPVSPQLLPDHAQALLALADGTVFIGRSIGAAGDDDRRGGLQHRAHRLSGNPDRSELLPADRHAHVSAHRQLRHERRGRRIGARLRRRPGRQGRAARANRTFAAAPRSASTCGARTRSASPASTRAG